MVITILVVGIATGAIYSLIGISYNLMYATSKWLDQGVSNTSVTYLPGCTLLQHLLTC
jgi:hypothetical protein